MFLLHRKGAARSLIRRRGFLEVCRKSEALFSRRDAAAQSHRGCERPRGQGGGAIGSNRSPQISVQGDRQ
jgi:hypothetical protein